MMSSFEDQEENPAEPVPEVATTAEPPQPPEPILEEEPLAGDEEEDQIVVSVSDDERNVEDAPSGTADSGIERIDKFSQTFIKFAKNLPIRRLVEIINTQVDHENNSLVFYCTSEELLRSTDEEVRE